MGVFLKKNVKKNIFPALKYDFEGKLNIAVLFIICNFEQSNIQTILTGKIHTWVGK